ncbi:MAG: ABC transporter permease [Gemmataceae bacterium]
MKFLAMLRDSLREALDAKVIFVTLGLSGLIIVVCATATFAPKPGAQRLMEFAALPLSVDIANFDPTQFRGGPNGPEGGGGPDPTRIARLFRGDYRVTAVTPVEGDERPGATFHVTLATGGAGAIPGLGLFLGGKKPETAMAEVRERFGRLDDVHMAEVLDVVRGDKTDTYVVTARLTAEGQKLWPHDLSLFFGALPVFREGVPLGVQLYLLETVLLNQVGAWVILLISVVLTAFFIPNMLRKGTVDLLIVKPVPRVTLLLYKYVGGLLFILINTTVAVGGVWLALAARSGIWAPGVLISIPAITFFFAILYSVSTLAGVVTRSAIVAILVTCGTWFFLFLAGLTYTITDAVTKDFQNRAERAAARVAANAVMLGPVPGGFALAGAAPLGRVTPFDRTPRTEAIEYNPGWFPPVVRAVRFFLPRTGDLTTLVDDRLQRDTMGLPRVMRAAALKGDPVSWGESLAVSGAFIGVVLGLACWWFATKDY